MGRGQRAAKHPAVHGQPCTPKNDLAPDVCPGILRHSGVKELVVPFGGGQHSLTIFCSGI